MPIPSAPLDTSEQSDLGLGLKSGDPHYRAFVGPPEDYDLIAGLQVSLLLAAGLRQAHRLLDIGCGSLRGGRMFIPYLLPDKYFGVEPNQWLVEEGLERELGRDILRVKRPRFLHTDDLDFQQFDTTFDFILAQSIFSHAYPDFVARGLKAAAEVLAPEGILLATYVEGEYTKPGSGWIYPGCVYYPWSDFEEIIKGSGLVGFRLNWPHPRQRWFVAARPEWTSHIEILARNLRPALATNAE